MRVMIVHVPGLGRGSQMSMDASVVTGGGPGSLWLPEACSWPSLRGKVKAIL